MSGLSSKATCYCVDGSNLVRSFWGACAGEEDIARFADWLERAAETEFFGASSFRVFFDGPHRDCGPTVRGAITIIFSGSDTADDIMLEQAVYLKSAGRRVALVTSDGGLADRAKAEGVKTMPCPKFLAACRKSLPEKY